MKNNHTSETADSDLEWETSPPAPVPGFFRMDVTLNVDTTTHDASLDQDFKNIHSPFTDFFPIDVLHELKEFSKEDSPSWLRTNENIDMSYFRAQSERRDIIKRDEVNEFIKDVVDYEAYVAESFRSIEEPLKGYGVVEEYPLFPMEIHEESRRRSYALVYSGEDCGPKFHKSGQKSSLVDTVSDGNQEFDAVKQSSENGLIIEIIHGRAYYTPVSCVYRFSRKR